MKLLQSAPARLMRLHQPVGVWLLLWPCLWSVALASNGKPSLDLLVLFGLGALVMRSAGCIINDMADYKFDVLVERTRTRPLASGEMSFFQAFVLLAALLCIALIIAMMLGPKVVIWAAASLPFVITYPFMKRISWWPQAFLGFTFNWGALLGWVAVRGTLGWPAMLLYVGGIFWTLGYDTIYGHQDKIDDARVGIKSSALRLGNRTQHAVGIFYLLSITFWSLAAFAAEASLLTFSAIALAQMQFGRQLWQVNLDDPASCKRVFVSNIRLGGLIFIGMMLSGIGA